MLAGMELYGRLLAWRNSRSHAHTRHHILSPASRHRHALRSRVPPCALLQPALRPHSPIWRARPASPIPSN